MPESLTLDIQTALLAMSITVPRVLVCLAILPAFGAGILKGVLRNSVAVAIAIPAALPAFFYLRESTPDAMFMLALAFKEAGIGLLFGLMLSVPMWVVQSIGSVFDLQRLPIQTTGSSASVDQDASVIGALLVNALVVFMIQAGLFATLARVLIESFEIWPAQNLMPPFPAGQFDVLMQRVGQFFWHIVVYGTPILLPLLLIDFGVAAIGVFTRHLPVSFITSPIKSLAGLFILLVYWPTLSHYIAGDFAGILNILPSFLRGAAGALR